MATIQLFQIKNGRATITDHCRTNAYYNQIIKKYGESDAVKIFTVFQYASDLNPETNPYANVSETEKLEIIIRACAADLPLFIDWDDELLQEGLQLSQKLFETGAYRAYLAIKSLRDKLTDSIHQAQVTLTKDEGNVGELNKALLMYETINESTRKAFSEFEAENGTVQRKGGRKAITRTIGGRASELE